MNAVTKKQEQVAAKGNGTQAAQTNGQSTVQITAEDVKLQIEAEVRAKLEMALATPPTIETAEPLNWWDGYAFGPFQIGAQPAEVGGFTPGPLLPHQVIKKGEQAYVATVLILNPVGPTVPTSVDILSNFALPYQVEYTTGDVQRWQPGPAHLQQVNNGKLTPGVAFYVDVFSFTAQETGLYEMNISFRIFGCEGETSPPFSGFATWVYDPDQDYLADLLGLDGGPGFYHKAPIRFQVYE